VATKVNEGTITSPESTAAWAAVSSLTVALHTTITVPDPDHLGYRVLQLLYQRTVVGQSFAVQDLVASPKQPSQIADVGASHVKRLAERGIAPEYR
jgi:hypothetical protein